ncbi:MAG: DsrE family protein [Nitrospirae bacterium]|nr:DsrE family protein [Nitrospirota bacterium]MCL5236787.1 DsrE family protein [Nitrospirota bacterium]
METKEVKIVWDVTIGKEALFEDRMGLIQHTADVVRRHGMTPKFVIVIHGPATKFVARSLCGTKFEKEKIERLPDIQRVIVEMDGDNVRFVQCQVPMTRNNVSDDNILPCIKISETAFFDLAVLQMDGYAYIPIYDM